MITVLFLLIAISFIFCHSNAQASPEIPEIIFTIPDTTLSPGETETYLNIYIDNFYDTIAGFQFQVIADRPDLVTFNFTHGGFDTAGTLVSGFEYVSASDTSGTGQMLWFRCIANADPFDGYNTPGFAPQQGGVVVRIPVNTNPNPDTTGDMTCNLTIIKPFDFSDPWGNSIGVVTDTLTDTIYYQCTEWSGDSCLNWVMVDGYTEPYDSIYIYNYLHGWLDTTVVVPVHGKITISTGPMTCDNNGDGTINIADITCLVNYLFQTWDEQSCPYTESCSWNNSYSTPTITDLSAMIDYLFSSGPPPGN